MGKTDRSLGFFAAELIAIQLMVLKYSSDLPARAFKNGGDLSDIASVFGQKSDQFFSFRNRNLAWTAAAAW